MTQKSSNSQSYPCETWMCYCNRKQSNENHMFKRGLCKHKILSYSHLCISPRRRLQWTVPWCTLPFGYGRRWRTQSRRSRTGTDPVRSPQGKAGCRSHSRRCWSGPVHTSSFQDSAHHSMILNENNNPSIAGSFCLTTVYTWLCDTNVKLAFCFVNA